jgi:cytochrome c oxidase subunit IV
MSSAETTATAEATEAADHDEHDGHPSDLQYVGIALFLAVLTGIEIALYYIDVGSAEVPALLLLMVLKFAIVALYFMHLKFDSPMANRMFLIGIFLAVTVYIAALATFTYWTSY